MNQHLKVFSLLSLMVSAWTLAGCGNLYRINYSNIKADLNYSGFRTVSVGVLDQRPYIISGENDPKYVGTMRGGYGNPFDLWTQSDLSLTDEMAATVAETLRSKGFKVLTVKSAVGKDGSSMLSEMKSSGAERLVFMVVKDWWSNYYPASFGTEKTELIMNVELQVMDRHQQILGSSRLEGIAIPPSGWPKDTIPGFYQRKMTELLNDQGIQRALK